MGTVDGMLACFRLRARTTSAWRSGLGTPVRLHICMNMQIQSQL
jgi:hypothetical protein